MSYRTIAPSPEKTGALLRLNLVLSGLSGAVGVVCLALSSHAAASSLLATISQMLLFHAPVFLGLGLLSQIRRVTLLPVVMVLMACGLLLFCGDIASRITMAHRLFPMAAPIGGMLVILSWITLALSALRIRAK